MFLQRVLPFLTAEQHDQLDDRGGRFERVDRLRKKKQTRQLKVKLVDCLEREYDGGKNKQSLAVRDDQRVEMLGGSFHINYLSNGCNAATAFQLPS